MQEMQEMQEPKGHLDDFFRTDYVDYAVYRVYQRLPHILDSLGQTQRKILYVMEQQPQDKKSKTAAVYSYVYEKTQYLHGDMSVYNVVENMARSCSNNLNLLTEEGSFGYRTDKSAASPRYTSTRFSKIARALFPKEDHAIYRTQEFEGKPIEPKFLLPVLPPSLINGFNAIAVGFASKFLPRNPYDVIDTTIKALQYRKRKGSNWDGYTVPSPQPAFPYFSGEIIHAQEHEEASAWITTGVLKHGKRNTIEVLDLPPDGSRESYIKKLKRLEDRGIIKGFAEGCSKNNFVFNIRVTQDMYKKNTDELMVELGLLDRVVENFTFLDPEGSAENPVQKFKDAGDYLKTFIDIRQQHYVTRKAYLTDKLNQEIVVLKERIRFITEVNADAIIITRRKKVDLEKELKEKEYSVVNGDGGPFDHLLGMRMYSLTEENIKKFRASVQQKEKELSNLMKTLPEDMHIDDLKNLRGLLKKELDLKGIQPPGSKKD